MQYEQNVPQLWNILITHLIINHQLLDNQWVYFAESSQITLPQQPNPAQTAWKTTS